MAQLFPVPGPSHDEFDELVDIVEKEPHVVTFKDADGNTLLSDVYYDGEVPECELPDGKFWEPPISEVTRDIVYIAGSGITRKLLSRAITVYENNSLTSVGRYALCSCASLTSISLPAVTAISPYAFANCTNLINVSLPVLTSLSSNAFYGCTSLTDISLPAATTIESSAFSECTNLTNVLLPVTTSLNYRCFYKCNHLISISLPAVTSLHGTAFQSCTALQTVILSSTIMATIESNLYIPSNTIFYVPDELLDSYKSANKWSDIKSQIKGMSELPSE